jgi:hypothetical protein
MESPPEPLYLDWKLDRGVIVGGSQLLQIFMNLKSLFRRSVAWPSDHGSWVFITSPLVIGLAVGGRITVPSLYLVIAVLGGFLVRQPITTCIKVLSDRRPRSHLAAGVFWTATYSIVGLVHVLGLVLRGFGYLLYLAIPGMLVFVWYLTLVAQRKERRLAVEVLAAGVLALGAPAGLWAGIGHTDPIGWLLWLLIWAQGIASILHVYVKLGHRKLGRTPTRSEALVLSRSALAVGIVNALAVACLGQMNLVAGWLFLPFLVQIIETIWATASPRPGARAVAIGFRQLVVTGLFTVMFIFIWN